MDGASSPHFPVSPDQTPGSLSDRVYKEVGKPPARTVVIPADAGYFSPTDTSDGSPPGKKPERRSPPSSPNQPKRRTCPPSTPQERRVSSLRKFQKKQELLHEEVLRFEESDLLDTVIEADLMQVRSYANPPLMIEMVLGNVHCLLGLNEDWQTIQRNLRAIRTFINQLRQFRPETVTPKQMLALRQRLKKCHAAFAPKAVGSLNKSCEKLCRWVNIICWRVGELHWLQSDARILYNEEAWKRREQYAQRAPRAASATAKIEQSIRLPHGAVPPKDSAMRVGGKGTAAKRGNSAPVDATSNIHVDPSAKNTSKDSSKMASQKPADTSTEEIPGTTSTVDTTVTLEWQLPADKVWVKHLLHAAELDPMLADALAWVEITGCTEDFLIVDENAANGLAMHLKLSEGATMRLKSAADQLASACPSPHDNEVTTILSPAETWARRSLFSGETQVPEALIHHYGESEKR